MYEDWFGAEDAIASSAPCCGLYIILFLGLVITCIVMWAMSVKTIDSQEVALPYQNGERSFGQSFLLRASLTPFAFAADLAAWPLEALAYGAWALLTP